MNHLKAATSGELSPHKQSFELASIFFVYWLYGEVVVNIGERYN